MPYVPKLRHLIKITLGLRDPQAAEGLFLEGSIEFEQGDLESARMMFLYGTRLDPNFGGNFYNLAVATEKARGVSHETVEAWEKYLEAAPRDRRQAEQTQSKVREHVAELKQQLGRPPESE